MWILICAIVAALLIITAREIRRRRIAVRNRIFGGSDRSVAAIAVYVYIQRLIAFSDPAEMDASGADGSERDVNSEDVSESADEPAGGHATLPEHLQGIALKARFSKNELSEEELRELTTYAEELSERTKNNTLPHRRLIGKYVYGLF
jgi:hypothetical protein